MSAQRFFFDSEMLTSPLGVLSWKCSRMMGKKDGAILEWVKSHLRYMQVIPLSRGNLDCGVGFASTSKRGCPSVELRYQGSDRGKSLQQTLSGENPIVE